MSSVETAVIHDDEVFKLTHTYMDRYIHVHTNTEGKDLILYRCILTYMHENTHTHAEGRSLVT